MALFNLLGCLFVDGRRTIRHRTRFEFLGATFLAVVGIVRNQLPASFHLVVHLIREMSVPSPGLQFKIDDGAREKKHSSLNIHHHPNVDTPASPCLTLKIKKPLESSR